jgi:hypothetical protein
VAASVVVDRGAADLVGGVEVAKMEERGRDLQGGEGELVYLSIPERRRHRRRRGSQGQRRRRLQGSTNH